MKDLKDWARALYPMHTYLITSKSTEETNIITVDWLTVISRKPGIVGVSIAPTRYSHRLIKESREFIVNVPSTTLLEEVYKCGVLSGRDCNKFESLGLERAPSRKLKTEIVKNCVAFLECRVIDSRAYGDHTLFVGEVVTSYATASFTRSYKPIFHIKGSMFSTTADTLTTL
jgi:flavin reductase (DIM6/NTAB) family NADH-FMN oxidoreductase RutF